MLWGVLASAFMPDLGAQTGDTMPSRQEMADSARSTAGSPYIPLDSWVYPAAVRLYNLGFLPTAFLGMRPWTRASLTHMLQLTEYLAIEDDTSEAAAIYDRLHRELAPEFAAALPTQALLESVYTRIGGIHGPILNDSFHLGQTIVNDFGRPSQPGFNNIAGFSARASSHRFSLSARGEFQHAPEALGYTAAVASALAAIDTTPAVPQSTISLGPLAARNQVRVLEANLAVHLLSHEISFGKSDAWLGPAQGASMAWSNNAENIYSLRINRAEPLYIPGLSRLTGFFRYDFFVGSLKGHEFPNSPWVHVEKISFKPASDLEFGFERTVIWAGKGHVPVTTGTFLRSFFSVAGVAPAVKMSRDDPGARFSTFDFNWRIPWHNHLVTLYTDSLVHDNVSPLSNPARAGVRPGIYLAHLPHLPRVDLRVEAVQTDPPDPHSVGGNFLYTEYIQKQGYSNRGQILGDWIGRESKGGQAWLTWHRKPENTLQVDYRAAKAASDFIPGGTTQQNVGLTWMWRPGPALELQAQARAELWRASLLAPGTQHDFSGDVELTWFPNRIIRIR